MFGTFYGFEEFFNHVAPFFFCWFPYLGAAVLAAFSWLFWRQPLLRAAWWLTVFAFLVHTLALSARIYISGRPPVTNLYSSAVFIGWGVILLAISVIGAYKILNSTVRLLEHEVGDGGWHRITD